MDDPNVAMVLFGDGEHDDTEAIQVRLDSGAALVDLPAPVREYRISKTLRIGSGQELRLPKDARVRLADGSNCPMLGNRDWEDGNRDIAVTGGIWDMNNLGQRHNVAALFWMEPKRRARWLSEQKEAVQQANPWPKKYDPLFFTGVCFKLFRIKGLAIRGVTIRNPTTYGIQLSRVTDFLADDITFDYQWGNPAKANMDGLHIDGGCSHGRITNLRGICYDDFVALNATDGADSPFHGPITDIEIDGIDCDYCHSAIRLLSRSPEHPVKRVSIRNVKGRFYSYGVGLTYFLQDVKERGAMDEILISDVRMSKAEEPADCWQFPDFGVIEVEKGVDIGSLAIERLERDEDHRPECDTIRLREGATVKSLAIRDCRQINRTKETMVFLHNRGSVGSLELKGTILESRPGSNVERDDITAIPQWPPKWKTLSDIAGWPCAAGYPKRGAMRPGGKVRAGFCDGLISVYPFVGEQASASDAGIYEYTEGGVPGYYAVDFQKTGIHAEATVSGTEAWFRIRYPEYVERKLWIPGRGSAVFSEPVLREEVRSNGTVYAFAPGWRALVVRIAADRLSGGGFDFDRTMSLAHRAWNAVKPPLFEDGRFFVGCNYWARHAGLMMWRDWRPDVVEKEFAALAENGLTILRVFPLWPDFQPLTRLRGWADTFGGWGWKDGREVRGDGVDPDILERFRWMCDAARRHGLRLVVGLVTGWMSGRLFVPPAFEGVNVITDGDAVMWQVRYVRRLVRELRGHPAIAAWDLGNECNCLAQSSQGEFWAWMNAIASAIRLEDATRPVVSGMHTLSTDRLARCPIRLNAELTDVLTVHPYPFFTFGCSKEPFNTMRNELHPTAEALLYSGVGGKTCFIEEVGNLGGNVASRERTAANVRCALYSAWTNDLKGYLWWCNADQEHLDFPPYDWTANERELGLFDSTGHPKPVLEEMRAFANFLDSLPFPRLPPRRIDAVAVVPEREDGWKAAFGTFLLTRQAGFDVRFAGAEDVLPDSDFYILVSSSGDDAYTHSAWRRLVARAEAGATLLVVKGASLRLTGLAETVGIEVDWMAKAPSVCRVRLLSEPGRPIEVADAGGTCRILAKGAEVLAEDAETGDAMMTAHVCRRGRILVINAPVDVSAIDRTDCFAGDSLNPAYLVYREAMRIAGVRRVVEKGDAPTVGLTEHAFGDGRTLIVAVNYGSRPVHCPITVAGHVTSVYRSRVENNAIDLDGNDVAVFEVR